jgi:predicted nucleotidyltransferase
MEFDSVIQKVVEKLKEDYSISMVLLIGSEAKGTARPDSDIDLLLFHDNLPESNNQDRIEEKKVDGKLFQLQHVTLKEIMNDISGEYDFRIDQLRSSKILFDRNNQFPELEQKVKNFHFSVNLKSRVEQAKDGLRKCKRAKFQKENAKAKLIALQTSFWLSRDYLNYCNVSKTGVSEFLESLKETDKEYYTLFLKTLQEPAMSEIDELEKCLARMIQYLKDK